MITVDLAAANVLAILRDLGGIMIPEGRVGGCGSSGWLRRLRRVERVVAEG